MRQEQAGIQARVRAREGLPAGMPLNFFAYFVTANIWSGTQGLINTMSVFYIYANSFNPHNDCDVGAVIGALS